MVHIDFKQSNSGGVYNINSVFGKGLVKAHLKADELYKAGTVLDQSFISEIASRGHNIDNFLETNAKNTTRLIVKAL